METLVKDYPGNPDHARALEDVRKELTELDQANAPPKTEPSPSSGTEPAMPKTDPKDEETEETPKSTPAPEPAKEEEQPK